VLDKYAFNGVVMSRLIIIFAEPRSGSNLLCEILECFSGLRVLNEFFSTHVSNSNPDSLLLLMDHERVRFSEEYNVPNETIPLIEAIRANPQRSLAIMDELDPRTKVIKIQRHYLDQFNLYFLFDLDDAIFITVKRRNKLRRFTSFMQAGKIEKWFKVDTSELKILTTADEFIKDEYSSIIYWEKVEKNLKSRNRTNLHLVYEDDFEHYDLDTILNRLQEYIKSNGLELDIVKKPITMFKQNNSRPQDVIGNWDWIKQNLGFD
jgi:hypothetical protein